MEDGAQSEERGRGESNMSGNERSIRNRRTGDKETEKER